MGVRHAPLVTSLALILLGMLTPTLANQYFLCPPTDEAIIQESPCPTSCIDDTQCQINSSDSLCCPTSNCGQQCVRALRVPYHHPILHCPEPDPDTVGACAEICASDTDCTTEGERCCSNGCGHGCTTAERVTPVCRGIVESHNGTVRPGEYVPQCEDDGSFSQAQNHASTGYWWCVRPDTGEPVGREMVKFTRPQCNNCSYKGQVYYPEDSFMDDCNTCWCGEDGGVYCTEIGCNVPRDLTFYSCPVLDDDTVGLCSEECSSDTDCKSYHKCCSNGCGHSCIDPIMIPFVPPPRSCPDYYEHALCDVQECTGSCADPRKLCCQNTCGSQVCTTGELPAFPCSATTSSLTGGALLGQYIPQCSDDGLFRSLQCSSHYCWCVDSQTGEPTSDMKENGHVNELECGGFCVYKGEVYNDGDVVETYQGCSKKKCIAGELKLSDICDDCVMDEKTYNHGETLDDDCYCACSDGFLMCARSIGSCGDTVDPLPDEFEWWHVLIMGAGTLIVILAIVAIALFVVVVVVVRNSHFRRMKLRENSDDLSFDTEMQVLFKNGPPVDGESVELKVPVEDEEDDVVKA